jgi:hypothetical protein
MKTTCILNGAIAPHIKQTLVEQLKSGVFSMSTDGSNDKDLDKMNPITVKLFDINASRAVIRFLDMGVTQGVDAAKASTIFEAIDEVMTDNSIPWKNCIAFSVQILVSLILLRHRYLNVILTVIFLDVHATFFIIPPARPLRN